METNEINETAKDLSWGKFLKPDTVSIKLFWLMFAETVLKDVPPDSIQYKEMRKAYTCGFGECFKLITDFAGNLTESEACEVFSRLSEEWNGLVEEYLKGEEK